MSSLKKSLKRLVRSLGFELAKVPPSGFKPHVDAHADQYTLLGGGKAPCTIFDLGANEGKTVARYRGLFPSAEIHCFEPGDEAFAALVQRFAADSAVKPQRLAVSRASGRQQFFMNKFSETNSLLRVSPESERYVDPSMTDNIGAIEVETVSLDDFCRARQITHIDILKMDIQGGELMALEGASRLFANSAISLIYTEILFTSLYENQASFDDLMCFLRGHGYAIFGLYNLNYAKNGVLAWGDALFISPAVERASGIA